jgi:hypothetical protein
VNQLLREHRQTFKLSARPAVFDRQVLALDVPRLMPRFRQGLVPRIRKARAEETGLSDLRLLRAQREQPAAGQHAEAGYGSAALQEPSTGHD